MLTHLKHTILPYKSACFSAVDIFGDDKPLNYFYVFPGPLIITKYQWSQCCLLRIQSGWPSHCEGQCLAMFTA